MARFLDRGNVDTMGQEKAVAFPTDAESYHKMRRILVRVVKREELELWQTFERSGKRALQRQGRHSHARQMKRERRETRKLRVYWGRVFREVKRSGEIGPS
jgi:IS5 family transposase